MCGTLVTHLLFIGELYHAAEIFQWHIWPFSHHILGSSEAARAEKDFTPVKFRLQHWSFRNESHTARDYLLWVRREWSRHSMYSMENRTYCSRSLEIFLGVTSSDLGFCEGKTELRQHYIHHQQFISHSVNPLAFYILILYILLLIYFPLEYVLRSTGICYDILVYRYTTSQILPFTSLNLN